MPHLTYITPTFAVAAALAPADFDSLARCGVTSVISNRPDGEAGALLTARQEAALAWRAGLRFAHVPAPKHDLFSDDVVEAMAAALARLEGAGCDRDGVVVAHCASGLRSAIVWAAASARSEPVDCVLAALARAGLELEALRDDLVSQAGRRRGLDRPAALDCRQSPVDGGALAGLVAPAA